MSSDREILYKGQHLALWRSGGWEYVEHRASKEAVMIVAITSDTPEGIVLVEEFRPAVNASVICLPAGLVGDTGPEETAEAARRELREETGYEASSWEYLGRGPGSAGASSEILHFYLAGGARLEGEQAPDDRLSIRVHVLPIPTLVSWAALQEARGCLVDPKIWAGLYLKETARRRA